MTLAYGVAAVAAATIAVFFTDLRDERRGYWRHWDGTAVRIWFRAPSCLTYAVAAVVVTAAVSAFDHAALTITFDGELGGSVAEGAVCAVLAFFLLTTDEAVDDILGPQASWLSHAIVARQLLAHLERTATSRIDEGTRRTIARKVGHLEVLEVSRASIVLYLKYYRQDGVDLRMQVNLERDLANWRRSARTRPDPDNAVAQDDWSRAVEALKTFVESAVISNHDAVIDLHAPVAPTT